MIWEDYGEDFNCKEKKKESVGVGEKTIYSNLWPYITPAGTDGNSCPCIETKCQ
jgi:hypothetical protein